MLKKLLIISAVFCLIFTYLWLTISRAASVPVTDENLKAAFEKLIESLEQYKNYEITLENKVISVKTGEENYTLNYDLTGNPTFSYVIDVKKGMDYTKFNEETEKLSTVILGYLAVANIQGVDFKDSFSYFQMYMLQSALSALGSTDLNNSYMIVADGVTVDNASKVIKQSEFGERVMEYVNATYKEKKVYKDTDGFNTFEMSTEQKDVTETSCKIVSTVTVNLDADFSKLKGMTSSSESLFNNNTIGNSTNNYQKASDVWANQVDAEDDLYETITNEFKNETKTNTLNTIGAYTTTGNNNTTNTTNATNTTNTNKTTYAYNTTNTSNATKNNTNSIGTLPYAGETENTLFIVGITICALSIIISGVKSRYYKDIK